MDIKTSNITLRDKLNDVINNLPPESVTLSAILELIGTEGLLVFCIFLTLPFMVPVSIPGVSTIFGAVIILLGIGIMFNRAPMLPKRFMQHKFPAGKLVAALRKSIVWLDRLEKISHPRLSGFNGPAMLHFNGFMIVLGGILLMFPFGLVPFSNTLPGLAVLFLSIGILQKDGVCVILGYLTNLGTIIYFAVLFIMGAVVVREISEKVIQLFSRI